MGIFSKIKEKVGMNNDFNEFPEEFTNDYVQIDAEKKVTGNTKVIVRPFMIEDFSDIKTMLDAIRGGYNIALVNIKPLKDKDIMELKRAVGKIFNHKRSNNNLCFPSNLFLCIYLHIII